MHLWDAFQILDVLHLSFVELRMKSACKSSTLREPDFIRFHQISSDFTGHTMTQCRSKIFRVEIWSSMIVIFHNIACTMSYRAAWRVYEQSQHSPAFENGMYNVNGLKGILASHHVCICDPGYVASVTPSSWSLPLVKVRSTTGESVDIGGQWTCLDAGDPPLNMRRLWQEMLPATLPNTCLGEVKRSG